ncbi:hypothetical protein H0Z09_05485 [Pseudomonas sp. SWRI18]|uniref:hypothetical protein n=1 Tax=Pseudomonas sp. SWRI18 TaxID=2753888 RepID=UPI00164686B6|nr:hypothetical protein [Pseudomonas sp. SWRI18]MBC3300563.1 hypothetical protein [Pseudomonas sp. SWRI18]
MYQVKGTSGADRWFIRYTDATGTPKVYKIRSDFKLRDDYVQVIDPHTRKPVMTLHSNADGEWHEASAHEALASGHGKNNLHHRHRMKI